MKQDKFFCTVYRHPDQDGDIIILPSELEGDIDPLNLVWGGYKLSGERTISIGRDSAAKIVAIHIPEDLRA